MKSTVWNRAPITLFVLCVAVTHQANAGWGCSIDHAYPEVSDLAIVDGQLVATLGRYFSSSPSTDEDPIQLVLGDNGEWMRATSPVSISRETTGGLCMNPPLDVDWLRRWYREPDRTSGFTQSISTCTTHENFRWGGIGYYGAEGGWGVGGLVREDLATGEIEYRRPLRLHKYSVSEIQYYANQLWMGTTHHGECSGPEPGFGLMRYNLATADRRDTVDEVPEVCGFAVRRFMVLEDELWVASELGLARAQTSDTGDLRWQNFVPDMTDDRLMRPVSCDGLYEELLRSPRLATDTAFDMDYAFEDFWNRLSQLRRGFVSRYLRGLHGHDSAGGPRD